MKRSKKQKPRKTTLQPPVRLSPENQGEKVYPAIEHPGVYEPASGLVGGEFVAYAYPEAQGSEGTPSLRIMVEGGTQFSDAMLSLTPEANTKRDGLGETVSIPWRQLGFGKDGQSKYVIKPGDRFEITVRKLSACDPDLAARGKAIWEHYVTNRAETIRKKQQYNQAVLRAAKKRRNG